MSDHPTHEDFLALTEMARKTAFDLLVCKQVLTLLLGEVAATKDDAQGFILKITERAQSLLDESPGIPKAAAGLLSKNVEQIQRQALESQGLRRGENS